MSLSEPSKGTPGLHDNHPYPQTSDRSRMPLPTLPPMSSLLPPHEQGTPEQYQQYSPRSHQPPHSETKHPLWLGEQDPNTHPQHIYHAPQVPPNSHNMRHLGEPLLVQTQNQNGVAVPVSNGAPLTQRRQIKKIVQRRDDTPKDPEPSGKLSASMSPTYKSQGQQHPQEQESDSFQAQELRESRSPFSKESPSQSQNSRSMPISGLLSEVSASQMQRAPQPKFTIRMRQEPMAARACGFGARDRRVIDPPPILQMDVESPTSTPEELSALIRQPYAVVHCTLWDPVGDCDDSAMPGTTDKRQQRRLMGTLVASPFVGFDEHDVEGCFFTFPDLSVRTPGTYSLKFNLVILGRTEMGPGHSVPITSSVKSSIFHVYNAKDFGGMRPSSELTKRLKHQGCLISVKKGNAKTGAAHARDEDEDDMDEDGDDDIADDDGDDGSSAVKRGKRPKR